MDTDLRRDGVRHVRRVSNWTAAALIVGTGAAAMALAHQAHPAAGTGSVSTGVTGAGSIRGAGTGTAATPGGPQVSNSVATTTASGVTVNTTTRTVNGKTVVTQTRSATPRGGDD